MRLPPGDVTRILRDFKPGSPEARDQLVPLVYTELRTIAARHLRREAGDHTLQPTALVHEAYLRLIDIDTVDWQNRSHFYAVASTVMRRVLVDHARAARTDKRGGQMSVVYVEEALLPAPRRGPEILALDDALDQLADFDPRQSKIVEMRFFGGMSEEEIGASLGISTRTVKRDWRIARAWLFQELGC